MKRKLKTWNNYESENFSKSKYGKSMTVPDQSMTLKQLLYNYTRGIPLPNAKEAEYLGDQYVPDFAAMDLSEIAEYRQDLRQEIQDIQASIKAADKEAAEKRKEATIKKTVTQVNETTQTPENQDIES